MNISGSFSLAVRVNQITSNRSRSMLKIENEHLDFLKIGCAFTTRICEHAISVSFTCFACWRSRTSLGIVTLTIVYPTDTKGEYDCIRKRYMRYTTKLETWDTSEYVVHKNHQHQNKSKGVFSETQSEVGINRNIA